MQAANCGQSCAKQTQPTVMSDTTNKYLKFDEPFFYRDGIFKLVTRYDKCVKL